MRHVLSLSRSQWFRSAVIKENAMPEGLMTLLFSNIDPIYEFHRGFLKELDQRLALWWVLLFMFLCVIRLVESSNEMIMETKICLFSSREGRSNAHVKGDYQRIGDVMLRNMCALKVTTLVLALFSHV